MNASYYYALMAALSSIAASLPASLEPAETQAVNRRISTLRSYISRQILELSYNDPRHPGL